MIFFEQFLEFPTKYDGWEYNTGYEEMKMKGMKKMVSTLSSLILEFWILLSHLLFTNRLKHEVNRSSGYPFCEKTPFRKSTSFHK